MSWGSMGAERVPISIHMQVRNHWVFVPRKACRQFVPSDGSCVPCTSQDQGHRDGGLQGVAPSTPPPAPSPSSFPIQILLANSGSPSRPELRSGDSLPATSEAWRLRLVTPQLEQLGSFPRAQPAGPGRP